MLVQGRNSVARLRPGTGIDRHRNFLRQRRFRGPSAKGHSAEPSTLLAGPPPSSIRPSTSTSPFHYDPFRASFGLGQAIAKTDSEDNKGNFPYGAPHLLDSVFRYPSHYIPPPPIYHRTCYPRTIDQSRVEECIHKARRLNIGARSRTRSTAIR